jgi:hypothetical protein
MCGGIDLDMEYRYWSFIEAHPAHTALSANAKVEAMDALTWAWTGELVVVTVSVRIAIFMCVLRSSASIATHGPCPVHSRRMPGAHVSSPILQQW